MRPQLSGSEPLSGRMLAARRQAHLTLIETLYPPGLSLAKHSHNGTYLTFVVRGTYHEGLGRLTDTCKPRTMRWLPAGETHTDHYPQGARCLHVEVGPSLTRRAERIGGPGELDGAMVRWAGGRLYGEFKQQDDVSSLAIEGLILELLAERARAQRTAVAGALPAWLKRAREILEDDFVSKRSLAELAAEVGVHPVHLCREFRNRYRTTIGDFVRRRRAEHGCTLLADAERPLAEIALACGFSDQSHFTAVFKRLIGTTPAEFRSTLV